MQSVKLLAMILLLWSSSCGGGTIKSFQFYSGPTLPANQVASIECFNLHLKSVDGRTIGSDGTRSLADIKNGCKISILPGQHKLELMVYMIKKGSDKQRDITYKTIRINVEAGHQYVLWGFDKDDGSKSNWELKAWDATKNLYQSKNDPLISLRYEEI